MSDDQNTHDQIEDKHEPVVPLSSLLLSLGLTRSEYSTRYSLIHPPAYPNCGEINKCVHCTVVYGSTRVFKAWIYITQTEDICHIHRQLI